VGHTLADGAMFNGGQSCCGVERVYADADVYDAVLAGVVEAASAFKVGDPGAEGTYLGPFCLPMAPSPRAPRCTAAAPGTCPGPVLPAHGAVRGDPRHGHHARREL